MDGLSCQLPSVAPKFWLGVSWAMSSRSDSPRCITCQASCQSRVLSHLRQKPSEVVRRWKSSATMPGKTSVGVVSL